MTDDPKPAIIRSYPVPDGTGFLNFMWIEGFKRLTIISICLVSLLGYYPNFGIPPVKQSAALAQVHQQTDEVISSSFSKPLVLPHPGYLSTKFSKWHPGVDIATGLGMPIHPIIKGGVLEVGRDFFGLGNFVIIAHEKGFKSKYAHMGKIYVKRGQEVTAENILGEVGLTGNTSGPHTHLEITQNGNNVDPQALLPRLPDMPKLVYATK